MELLVTIGYLFLIRLVFFDYKWLRFNAAWGLALAGLWCAAALTEVLMLGQFTPYTKKAVVSTYVLQIAPDFGGFVKEVKVTANTPLKKGDVLFEMDAEPWKNRVAELEPQVATAQREYDDTKALVAAQVEREVDLVKRLDRLDALKASLREARYNLEHATLRAPTDGYVIDLQLRPGVFIRLKQPVMTFISTDSLYVLGAIPQVAVQRVQRGDRAEIALDMYPGRVFEARVEDVIFGSGEAQFTPGGVLPRAEAFRLPENFAVRLQLSEPDPERPLRFGASGIAAIYTSSAADALIFLRRLEIQSESFLNYLYNPF